MLPLDVPKGVLELRLDLPNRLRGLALILVSTWKSCYAAYHLLGKALLLEGIQLARGW
jgi:hypothetical protein